MIMRPWLGSGSYLFEEINGQKIAFIEFETLRPVELTIGDSIQYDNNWYYLRHREDVTKQETSMGFKYGVKFYHGMYRMQDVVCFPYKDPDFRKGMSKYNGNARQVLDLVVKSMNRVDSGWSIADCDETPTETFDLKDKTCADVINDLLSRYNSEIRVDGSKAITFGKRHTAGSGRTFFQGFGGGFREIRLSAIEEAPPVTRLFAYGSDKNMAAAGTKDALQYLPLPGGAKYIEKNVDKYGVIELSHPFDQIYPKGIFTVTAKIDEYTLQASGIDFDLEKQLIDNTDAVVTFQDGGLAGYDLNIVKGSWDNSKKQFKLAKVEEESALKVPGDIHFAVGDKFILTNIRMPKEYVDRASEELKQAAQKYLDERCEIRTKLNVVCDEVFFAENGISIKCGELLKVKDERLGLDKEIRVTAVKAYMENQEAPYRFEITLSDFIESGKFAQTIRQIADETKKANETAENAIKYSKRRWQDVKEAQALLMEDFKKHFSEKINPVSIETMQLIVGHEQLQFVFVNSKTEPQKVVSIYPEFKNGRLQIKAAGTFLKHMTMGIKTLSSRHGATEYRYWSMPDFTSEALASDKVYRIYAKVEASGGTGTFVLSETFKEMNAEAGYYMLFIGYSHTEKEGDRAFSRVYGFTEILPGQITTDIIQDPAANLVLDLAAGRLTGPITMTAGSYGYNNLTDKPDLSGYLTKAELKVESDKIRAEVGVISQSAGKTKAELEAKLAAFQSKVNNDVNNLISKQQITDGEIYRFKTAGYMTQDGVNAWWSAGVNERGQELASYITQTPSTLSLLAQNLNLEGNAVFKAYRQKTDNTSDTLQNTNDKVSNLNHELNRTNSDVNNLRTAAEKARDAVNALPSWAKKRYLKEALESETIIQGGFINTSLINAKALNVEVANVGGFRIENKNLVADGISWESAEWSSNSTDRMALSPTGGIKISKAFLSRTWSTKITSGEVKLSAGDVSTTLSGTGIQTSNIDISKSGVSLSVSIGKLSTTTDWHPYVQLRAGIPHKSHLGGGTFRNVLMQDGTGLFCWE